MSETEESARQGITKREFILEYNLLDISDNAESGLAILHAALEDVERVHGYTTDPGEKITQDAAITLDTACRHTLSEVQKMLEGVYFIFDSIRKQADKLHDDLFMSPMGAD